MEPEVSSLLRLVEQVLGYAVIYGSALAGIRGGTRISMANRPDATRAAARRLAARPGRCLLAGVAALLAGWAALALVQHGGPLPALLVGALWLRSALHGFTAFVYQRGRELQAFETPEASSDAEALERGTWAVATAFFTPFLGWAAFAISILLGLGSLVLKDPADPVKPPV